MNEGLDSAKVICIDESEKKLAWVTFWWGRKMSESMWEKTDRLRQSGKHQQVSTMESWIIPEWAAKLHFRITVCKGLKACVKASLQWRYQEMKA